MNKTILKIQYIKSLRPLKYEKENVYTLEELSLDGLEGLFRLIHKLEQNNLGYFRIGYRGLEKIKIHINDVRQYEKSDILNTISKQVKITKFNKLWDEIGAKELAFRLYETNQQLEEKSNKIEDKLSELASIFRNDD